MTPQPPPTSPQQPYPPQARYAATPVFRATFTKHTGMLVMTLADDVHVVGGYEEVRRAYHRAQLHNACLGWWGVISLLVYNWMAIIGNISAMSEVKNQARAAGLDVERPPPPRGSRRGR